MDHAFEGSGSFCNRRDPGPAGSSLRCGFGRLAHDHRAEPLAEPMHYWPPSGPGFVCDVDQGFKSSASESVTCPKCIAWLQRERAITDAMRETGESREIVTDLLGAIESCASEGASEALAERRQTAREAAFDNLDGSNIPAAVEACIEAATRVRITPEIVAAGYPSALTDRDRKLCAPLIAAAFRAAGFEVVA